MIAAVLFLAAVVTLVRVHWQAIKRRDLRLLAITLWLEATAVTLALVAWRDRTLFEAWMQEDGWVEWGTFFAFLLAALLRSLKAVGARAKGLSGTARIGAALIALFCLFVALEEISWGQRLFSFEPPEVFLAENYQQEINVHNFLKDRSLAGMSLDSRFLIALIALAYGVIGPALATVPSLRRHWLGRAFAQTVGATELLPWAALIAAAELAYPVSLTGEAAELMLGLYFLADGLRKLEPRRKAHPASPTADQLPAVPGVSALVTAAALMAPLLLGVITTPLLELAVFGSDEDRTAVARTEVNLLRQDLARPGAVSPKLLTRNVHKRLYTAMEQGYITWAPGGVWLVGANAGANGQQHRDRKRYFLDPWMNPYWLHKRGNRLLIYSFGPNRRRDIQPDAAALDGKKKTDDLVVEVALEPATVR